MLDHADLKILLILKQDARISLTKIAKEVSLSVPAVTYRLNKLIDKKIIKNFTITIDENKLTPNYTSYLIKGKISGNIKNIIDTLNESGYLESIIVSASHYNLTSVTRNVTTENLNSLLKLIESLNFNDYEVVPILHKGEYISNSEIVAEDVSSIYCPRCQKTIDGQGIMTTIGSQIMGFCCVECKEEFVESYEKISEIS